MTLKSMFYWFLLAVPGIALSTNVHAEEPVPSPKPLETPGKPSFVEGVDVPLPKPIREKEDKRSERLPPQRAAVCDLPSVVFKQLEEIHGETAGDTGCGIATPVEISGVNQNDGIVKLNGTVTLSCSFAKVFTEWLKSDVLPIAEKQLSAKLQRIETGPGYQCRRRNNQPDGKLSEHALGKAIDITGFRFAEGIRVSVEADWGKETASGAFLNAIRESACEKFTTVLSPEGDSFHQSHLHLDIGCHGSDCTYLICD